MGLKPTYEEMEQRVKELEIMQGGRAKMARIFEKFTNAATEGLATADLDGKLTYVNPALGRMLGGDPHEIVGTNIKDYYQEKDLPNLEKNILPAVEIEVPQKVEMPLMSLQGKKTDFIQSIFLIHDEEGNPHYANVTTDITDRKQAEEKLLRHREELGDLVAQRTNDLRNANEKLQREITERKQAEEALQEREARLRFSLEGSGDGTWEWDLRKGGIRFSEKAKEILGVDQNKVEFQRSDFLDFTHPDHVEYLDKTMKELREGITESYSVEFPIKTRDGDWRWLLSRGKVFSWSEEGKPERVFGTTSDITERKRAEDELRESEIKFRSVFNASPQAISLTDAETGTLIDVNDKWCEMTRLIKEDVIGRTATELGFLSKVDRDSMMCELQKSGEMQKAKEDSKLNSLMFSRPIEISGKRVVLNMFVDITERKRAEEEKKQLEERLQQAQKMEAVGTLAGGIAHDFNNLLMGIQGNTSLMLLGTDSAHDHYDKLKSVENLVLSGAKLTNQLLGYARKGKYEVKPIDLNLLVKESSETFGRTRKEIAIRSELAEDLFPIEVDQGQIQQVLFNLYVNAADAMLHGGELFLRTDNVTHEAMKGSLYDPKFGNYVRLTITDNGVGMDEETKLRLFEPFFTTKAMGRGTGLGLASVYGIVKSHGGYIDVESEQGKGTTFMVYLQATQEAVEERTKSAGQIVKGAETILLVDDEEIIRKIGLALLEQMGYTVLLAQSGAEAVAIYEKDRDTIDLVILDMIMPDMNGGEVYDRLKETVPGIKVLLSSGYSIDGQASEILERGCDGFIQKPFNIEKLSQKIREVLDKQ